MSWKAVPSLADRRRRRYQNGGVGPARPQPGDDLRDVRDRAFRQIADLGARVGQDLLARAVIEFLGDVQRLRSRPAEARAAQLLERGQVVQPGRALPPVLDPHPERSLEVPRGIEDRPGIFALQNPHLRRVLHPEGPALGMRRGHHLEIPDRHELADLDLAPARDRQRRRLDPADADHALCAPAQRHRRRPGQRQVVDLVGLPARHRRRVEPGVLFIGPGAPERHADGLRVLRREQHPHRHAPVAAMLQDLLADQLSLAVAVGGEPHPVRRLQRRTDRLQLGRLVAARRRFGAIQSVGPQQFRRPALPCRVDVLGLAQVEQVPLRREHGSVAGPDRGAHIPGLARLLGNHDLAGHRAPSAEGAPSPVSGRAASMAARNGPANCFSLAAPTPLTATKA